MSDEYTPRAGTAAQKVIEFLQKQPAGASFTGPELEAKLKVKSLSIAMRKPVEHGLVQSEKRGNALVFSLAAPPPALRRQADDRQLERRGCDRRRRREQRGRQRHVHARAARAAAAARHHAAHRSPRAGCAGHGVSHG